MIQAINILLPFLYAAVVWSYGKAFFSDVLWAQRIKTPLLGSVILLHFVGLALRTMESHHPPVTNIFEIFSMLAFSIAFIYLLIELIAKVKETGYFIINIAFFFQTAASIFDKGWTEVPEVLRSTLFGIHVTAALLGYSAIAIAAVYGFLYLMLYHEMKASRFGPIYKKLPNLEKLEQMTFTAITLAFLFLSVAIAFGFIWLPRAIKEFSYADPKLIGTILVWALYGGLMFARRSGRWKGRKVMVLSIFGFAVSIFSMTVINMFFSSFHRFY
jgi:ABC-type uncharacterized transport system permease subunit